MPVFELKERKQEHLLAIEDQNESQPSSLLKVKE
jgi:hypothetical protein